MQDTAGELRVQRARALSEVSTIRATARAEAADIVGGDTVGSPVAPVDEGRERQLRDAVEVFAALGRDHLARAVDSARLEADARVTEAHSAAAVQSARRPVTRPPSTWIAPAPVLEDLTFDDFWSSAESPAVIRREAVRRDPYLLPTLAVLALIVAILVVGF